MRSSKRPRAAIQSGSQPAGGANRSTPAFTQRLKSRLSRLSISLHVLLPESFFCPAYQRADGIDLEMKRRGKFSVAETFRTQKNQRNLTGLERAERLSNTGSLLPLLQHLMGTRS